MFSGNAVERSHHLAGILPYITASIIMELLAAIPTLAKMKKSAMEWLNLCRLCDMRRGITLVQVWESLLDLKVSAEVLKGRFY
jgi:preprotein translocase subunit SecY